MENESKTPVKQSSKFLHTLPDIFTAMRIPIGLAIAVTGIIFGKQGVYIAYWLLLSGWTTDIFDGNIARKVGKEKTWIGEHDILFDSIMLLGVIFYLGYTGFVPMLLAVVSFILLLYVNVYPNIHSQTTFFVESVITCTTLPFLLYLSWNPLTVSVSITWAILNILYDIDRAMFLKQKWQKVLVSIGETIRSYPLRTNLSWAILVIGIMLGASALIFEKKFSDIIGGILKGIAVAMILIGIWALWLGRKKQDK